MHKLVLKRPNEGKNPLKLKKKTLEIAKIVRKDAHGTLALPGRAKNFKKWYSDM